MNVVKRLIFPLLRLSALIILFKENISSSLTGSQLSVISLNCHRSLNQFLVVKSQSKKSRRNFFSRGICLRMSWACTIGIWGTLTQWNLFKQIYALCYNTNCKYLYFPTSPGQKKAQTCSCLLSSKKDGWKWTKSSPFGDFFFVCIVLDKINYSLIAKWLGTSLCPLS